MNLLFRTINISPCRSSFHLPIFNPSSKTLSGASTFSLPHCPRLPPYYYFSKPCRYYSEKKKKSSKEKDNTFENLITEIESTFGKGVIQKLDSTEIIQAETISTGSLSLDIALGLGGLPKGRIVEIFGPEASGKTSLALSIVAQGQKAGGKCAFIDIEHALDPAWAKKLGVDTDKLIFTQPDSAEQALDLAYTFVSSGHISVVVIDSVAALVPRTELEGNMGELQIGLQARLMSQALRKLTGVISKSNTIVIFINQIRMKIGVLFGNPETTSGGTALRYSSSIRLDVRKATSLKNGDNIIGTTIRVKVTKNKVAPPYKQAEFDIFFDTGFSRTGELLDLGIREEIIEKIGNTYQFNETEGVPAVKLGVGREKARQFLDTNPELCKKIENKIRKQCIDNRTKPIPEDTEDIVPTEE